MFEAGEIILIPVPFTDLSSSKRRPVLVLSKCAYNHRSPDIIVAAITSNPHTKEGVAITQLEMESGTLPIKSFVRPDKVYTLSKSIVIKKIGRVRTAVLANVLACLDAVLEGEKGGKG